MIRLESEKKTFHLRAKCIPPSTSRLKLNTHIYTKMNTYYEHCVKHKTKNWNQNLQRNCFRGTIAKDIVMMTESEGDIQSAVDEMYEILKTLKMKINSAKIKIFSVPETPK